MLLRMKALAALSLAVVAALPAATLSPDLPAGAWPAGPGSHPVIPLWPDGAPGSAARRHEPEKIDKGNVSNIHDPSIAVYLPAAETATGCGVLICPGGGHRNLVMQKEGYDLAEWFNLHGIAAFVLKSRLANDSANPADAPQPYTLERDSLADLQRALRLIRRRAAEWSVDPVRVGVLGFSAGGELAALGAMRPAAGNPAATDPLDRLDARPAFQALVYPGRSQTINPAKGAPPAFLACGADDRPDISEGLAQVYLRFKSADVPVELHIYAGVGHGFGLRPGPSRGWPDRFREWLAFQGFLPARVK